MFGGELEDLLPIGFIREITGGYRESILVHGHSFPFPLELSRCSGQSLATRHLIARQFPKAVVSSPAIPARPIERLLYVSDPSGTLPYESVESVFFSEILAPSHTIDVQMATNMTVDEFCGHLSASHFDAIHFTGHGRYDGASGGSMLLFADGELSAADLASVPVKRPPRLVVLNVCSTAADTSLAEPDSGTVTSLAKEFLIKGTEAVVGTLWPIADCSAAKFSTAFYRYVLDCQVHVETALFLMKRRYLVSEDTMDIARYVLYTLPGAHVQTLRKEWAVDWEPGDRARRS